MKWARVRGAYVARRERVCGRAPVVKGASVSRRGCGYGFGFLCCGAPPQSFSKQILSQVKSSQCELLPNRSHAVPCASGVGCSCRRGTYSRKRAWRRGGDRRADELSSLSCAFRNAHAGNGLGLGLGAARVWCSEILMFWRPGGSGVLGGFSWP